jgi:hypothetical protein
MTTHDIDSTTDLFQAQDTLPENVRAIIDYHTILIENDDGNAYLLCRDFLADIEPHGYTFDYGLDGVPYDLQRIELPA